MNIFDICNYIIHLANSQIDEDFSYMSEWVTHLKLQKILYFTQATYLSCLNKIAFNEKILAYKYWPVIEEVYQEYKKEKNKPLDTVTWYDSTNISLDDKKILDFVWEYFWRYTAYELVNMTHAHSPRKETDHNKEISTQSMKEFYNWRITLS